MYHTLIDDMEHLENGSIQHMGDNLLALLNEISASKILEQPETRDIGAFFEIFGIIHRKYYASLLICIGWYLVLIPRSTIQISGFVLFAISAAVYIWNPYKKQIELFNTAKLASMIATILGITLGTVSLIRRLFIVSVTVTVVIRRSRIFDAEDSPHVVVYVQSSGVSAVRFTRSNWATDRSIHLSQVSNARLYVIDMTIARLMLKKYSNSEPRPYILEVIKHNSFCGVLMLYAILLYCT